MKSRCKKKILFFDHSPVMGGAERSLLDIILGIKEFEPIFVTPSLNIFSKFSSKEIKCIHFPIPINILKRKRENLFSFSDIYNLPFLISRFVKLLKQETPDLVYTNTQKAHLIGVIGSKIARIPCLSHFRDILPDTMLTKIWLYIFCLFTTKIIAISKAVRDRLPIKRKIKIIYNGVKMYPSSLQKSNSKCIIGYVGQIARWKGVEYFIKAAGLIQKELPKANFIVVGGAIFGDTQYLKELKQLALNLSLNGKLQFVGKKEDPIPYINKLDILVHPPVEPEPFGRILIEASLLGKPIVASHIGAIPEIIKDEETGILVPPRDSSAIASAIKRLINNPEFAKSMGERAKERAIKYFNVNKMVKEIEKTIIKTMEKNL